MKSKGYRMFSGRAYTLALGGLTKEEADKEKDAQKKRGMSVRIARVGGWWGVFIFDQQ